MTVRQRSAGLALVALCGSLAALAGAQRLLGALPVPCRPAQRVAPSSPEPPLADAPPVPPTAPGPAPGAPLPADPPAPVVALRVRAPSSAAAGQELEYRICVENRSRAAAHHVLVRDPLPANARFVRAVPEPTARKPELLWSFGTLRPGECREILLVLIPDGTGDVKNCARVQFEHGECVSTRINGAAPLPPAPPASTLALTKQGPAQAVLYDSLSYQLEVTNTGGVPATGVALTDTLPEGLEPAGGKSPLTWDLGTLAPGQRRTVEYQAIAKKAGRWTNQAVVTGGGARREASSTVVVGEPKMDLTMTGPERRHLNRPATYQISVSNPGTAPATNVMLTARLPDRTTFVSAGDGGRLAGQDVQWSLGTLPPGTRKAVQLVLRATVPGEVVNRAAAKADRGLKAEAAVHTTFEGVTGLTVDVDDQDDPVEVGARTKYTITVLNQGAAPATNVVVSALVPAEMEVTGAAGPSAFRRDGPKVVFAPATVQPKQEVLYEVSVKALRAGDVRFKVDVSADQLTAGPVHREESTTIYNPNIPPAGPPAGGPR